MVRFSIVTINWNNLAGLKETYRSLTDQTYRNFRWIVIDGASKDGSGEWLNCLDDSQAEITIEPDKGIYDAMDKGRRRAVETPGYTLFLNSGDSLADPTVLERINDELSKAATKPKFIYGDFFRQEAGGVLKRTSARPIERAPLGLPASHQTMYFENERLRQFKFRLDYKLSADYCLLLEFLQGLDLLRDVMQLSFPLCIFDTSGVSHKRRFEAIREDMDIRTRFLNFSKPNAFALYVLHYVHTHTKQLRASLGR
ncbi:glycosyltransferase [Pseudomonas stutzeri]|uniref:Glycosyl transferase family 2 n=1 Tax=Stutzerimonas stutzeri TaxID=316 RepID=A0A2N8SPQ1_STUST|nr:glycosyltransferase [Stutzerimonas stutzeri]MCQ4248685.1 glycosyltransferase [Stutzerimonas stutzeri]PNG04464.1 glycosyl transferase family 2 [Stutzerimonas stutzeri]